MSSNPRRKTATFLKPYAGTIGGKPPSRMTDEELMAVIREGEAQLAAMCNMKPNDLALVSGLIPTSH